MPLEQALPLTYKPAVIFDIDGTFSDPEHRREHAQKKDWEQFFQLLHLDPPIKPVIKTLRALQASHNYIVLVTGRPERYRYETIKWLEQNDVRHFKLYMRGDNDRRPDFKVKSDMLDQIQADGYSPFLVFDDRQQVVDMWRERGLVVLQNKPFEEAPTAQEAEKLLGRTPKTSQPLSISLGPCDYLANDNSARQHLGVEPVVGHIDIEK